MIHTVNCVSCGECIKECFLQMNAIEKWEGGVKINLDLCMGCGHCAAVCPTGLMDNPLAPLDVAVDNPLDANEALRFLRTPRSVRRYRAELVPHKVLEQLLNAGRYPMTGKNTQGISYIVVEGKEKMAELNRLYCKIAKELPADAPLKAGFMRPVIRQEEEGFDALFYGSQQMIFALCDPSNMNWFRNAQFSLTFIALMAPSLGLGTCWCGQLERLASDDRFMNEFGTLIGLPEGKRICGCMMVGYPDVRFRRLVSRDPLDVTWR